MNSKYWIRDFITFLIMFPVLITWGFFGYLADKFCRLFKITDFLYSGSNYMLYIFGPISFIMILSVLFKRMNMKATLK